LKKLRESPSIYAELDDKTNYLHNGLEKVFKESNIPVVINQLGSMISVHFSERPVVDFSTSVAANTNTFNKFFHAMLNRGIYLPPSAFETWFVSNALTTEDLDYTINSAKQSLVEISPQ
jgi:glutamate-1-semialdehyde 2,1-aminomutase